MADEKKYEHKTVKAVRGTDRVVISKMEKAGWELVDQTPGNLRTSLTFRRRKKLNTWIPIGAALVVLAGIITVGAVLEDDTPKPPTQPRADVPEKRNPSPDEPAKNATYESVDALMDAAIKAGYPCPARKVEPSTSPKGGSDRGTCSPNDVFSLASITRSEDELDQAAADLVDEVRDDPALKGATYLVGPNWGINGPRAELLALQKRLGGAIAAIP